MDVKEAIDKRRSLRSLKKVEISENDIFELANSASLAPSCYNNQPWRFVFVKSANALEKIFQALPEGNSWAKKSSMIIAVYSEKENDCIVGGREYYLFDTGLAVGFMLLRATELGLVTHIMVGFDVEKVKESLEIPEKANLIALISVGGYAEEIDPDLSDWQKKQEIERPERKPFEEFARIV